MIVVNTGENQRLGNLMFNIGMAYTIQSKLENHPEIYCKSNKLTRTEYFKNTLKPIFFKDIIFSECPNKKGLRDVTGGLWRLVDIPIEDNLFLRWHFQNCIDLDLDLLRKKYDVPDVESYVYETYPEVFCTGKDVIGINVRRGDFLTFENGTFFYINDISFYKRALDEIGAEGKNIFIVSDDIKWCKENFVDFGDSVFFSNKPDVLNNMKELMMCDYLILGSSSTYSIWCSYLNTRKKMVIYPNKLYKNEKLNFHKDILFAFDNYRGI